MTRKAGGSPRRTGTALAFGALGIDRGSSTPLYRQVYESVRTLILQGTWRPGEQVPSLREMMRSQHLSRNTVLNAYQQLCAEGYLENRQGAGFFVADLSFDILRSPEARSEDATKPSLEETCLEQHEPPPSQSALVFPDPAAPAAEHAYDFSYGNLTPDAFPLTTWRKLCTEALYADNGKGLGRYFSSQGQLGLRLEIARYLERARNVSCTPEQVFLTTGIQQSMERLLLLFDAVTCTFGMEEPGFPPVRQVVRDRGFPLRLIPCHQGPKAYLQALRELKPQLIYATPSHQMPTGSHLGMDARLQLLEHAQLTGAYVLEDDYDSVFRFDSQPIPTLTALDTTDRVIYLGTFSKLLAPALRIGYIVLPKRLLERAQRVLGNYRCGVSLLEQDTLRLFMSQGHWERHVRRMEHAMRDRHGLLVDEIQRQMPDRVTLHGADAGLHLILEVRNGMDQDQLVSSASAAGVLVQRTDSYWDEKSQAPANRVMLAFSAIPKDRIAEGVHLLRNAWFG